MGLQKWHCMCFISWDILNFTQCKFDMKFLELMAFTRCGQIVWPWLYFVWLWPVYFILLIFYFYRTPNLARIEVDLQGIFEPLNCRYFRDAIIQEGQTNPDIIFMLLEHKAIQRWPHYITVFRVSILCEFIHNISPKSFRESHIEQAETAQSQSYLKLVFSNLRGVPEDIIRL